MKSIRLQLPFSYAAIALLATLALGALMLWRLNDYYSQHEVDSMRLSAQTIQMELQTLDLGRLPEEVLQAQVESFAYFARSRVRLYAPNGVLLADSGEVDQTSDVIRFAALPAFPDEKSGVLVLESGFVGSMGSQIVITPDPQLQVGTAGLSTAASAPLPAVIYSRREGVSSVLPVLTMTLSGGASGFEESSGARSIHSVDLALTGRDGQPGGRLVLSGGPAFGRQIVSSVAQAWALAGCLAVALAGAAGWWASRRITRPVLALAEVTGRMASGDLAARSGNLGGQEFSALGRSFNEMASRIEATVQTLRRFAADAAHELKTPLTALRTDLDLAGAAGDPARLAELLARAREQVLELDHLTAGLLDLSRLDAGTIDIEQEALDLVELARQLSERIAARAEQAGQEFDLEVPEAGVWVRANRSRLALALNNLLENALKFTPAGGQIRLVIRTDGALAQVAVEDSGIGIPEGDLPQLFERFHRGRNAAGYPGSGLGLAIVRAVAEAHGGTVEAENRAGGGARFILRLPVQ